MGDKTITIVAPARLHFGLVALTQSSSRAYGGSGLAVWHRKTIVDATKCSCSGAGLHIAGIPKQIADRIMTRLQLADIQNVMISVRSSIEPHIGLGAGTSLTLACVEAATRVVGLDLSNEDLQVLSGRGGASGVGVNSYFLGGLVGDGGRAGTGALDFHPSSASQSPVVPKVLYRVDWPNQWQVAVMQLKNAAKLLSRGKRLRWLLWLSRSSFPVASWIAISTVCENVLGRFAAAASSPAKCFSNL